MVPMADAALGYGVIIRGSTDSAGQQANDSTYDASLSAYGRYMVFSSRASNLVPGDTNGASDIFIKDLQTGVVTRVSTDSDGNQSDPFHSWHPSISPDGRYVTFSSSATNLVPGDTNSASDIFMKDLQTGATTRVSTDSDGNQSDNYSYYTSVSEGGRFVAFRSSATNLVADDTNGKWDIFLKDTMTGATTRVSTDSDGNQGNGVSKWFPKVSADGRYVVFSSASSNLVPGDSNGAEDIFIKDMQTGSTSLVSTDASGGQGDGGSYYPNISPDARHVAFISTATNLVAGDANDQLDIFVKDVKTGAIARASTDSSGAEANGINDFPVISADGRYVAFYSSADNLVPGDLNGTDDVFVKDMQTGDLSLLSMSSTGVAGNDHSRWPAISGDGRLVAFYSYADNLVSGDTNGAVDIFIAAAPSCSCSQPELTLKKSATYWQTMADYQQRLLSSDFLVTRSGGIGDVNLVGASNTSGVVAAASMPLSVGYSGGGQWDFTMKYAVPMGVSSFRTTIYVNTSDICGKTHDYPGPWK